MIGNPVGDKGEIVARIAKFDVVIVAITGDLDKYAARVRRFTTIVMAIATMTYLTSLNFICFCLGGWRFSLCSRRVRQRLKPLLMLQSPPVLKRCSTWGNPKTALFATRTDIFSPLARIRITSCDARTP
jgi:hypothetical protein